MNTDLNEDGLKQADAFFKAYQNTPFDKIYISKLKRTQQSIQQFIDLGSVPVGSTPDEFRKYVHDEVVKWAEVAREAHVTID